MSHDLKYRCVVNVLETVSRFDIRIPDDRNLLPLHNRKSKKTALLLLIV